MIEHVRRRAIISKVFDKVLVVTNNNLIKELNKYKAKTIITKKNTIMEQVGFLKYLKILNMIMHLFFLQMNHCWILICLKNVKEI